MFKRIISYILISILLVLSTYGSCFAADTSGAPSRWAKSHVERAIQYDLVPEKLQKDYQKTISREEFASLLVQTIFSGQKYETDFIERLESDIDYYLYDTIVTRESVLKQVKVLDFNFTDTQSEDVKLAYIMGLVNGTSATSFEPDKLLTRQDAAAMLSNYAGPESTSFNDSDFCRYYDRFTDLNKAASWAKDAVNLAFLRHIIDGDASKADRHRESKKKITLNPLVNLTREQAVVMMDKLIFYKENTSYVPINIRKIYLRGCVPYFGDCMGISWEVSKNSVKAVALSERLKKYMKGYAGTASRQFECNYPWIREGQARRVSLETHIAAVPRLACPTQFFTEEQGELIATGKNVAFDIGLAEYEANNPDYVFEYRLKNNGFYTALEYCGGKLIDIKSKQIK